MSIVRLVPAAVLAVVVTLGLLMLMHILIQNDIRGPGEVSTYKIPEIVMPDREIKTEFDTSKPDRPEELDEPPPDIPEPEFDNQEVSNESLNIQPAFDKKIEIGGISMSSGEMIPLTVIQPDYPRRALQRGKEGYCTVEFTVSAAGTTKDPVVVDCPDRIFERASLKASSKVKYKPRVVDGQAVDVPGVQYKFLFQMAKEQK